MMINNLYTVILSILFYCTLSKLNQTATLNNFNCKINYASINNTLSLQNCQPIDPSISNFYFTDWKNCITQCCKLQFDSYPIFNQQNLNTCKDNNNSNGSQMTIILKVIIIVLSITLGITLVVFIIYKIKVECLLNESKRIIASQEMIRQNQISDIKNIRWCQQKENQTQSNLNGDENRDCAICLEENTTLVLTCSHRFHVKCLLSWFKKNRSCPLCKRTKLDKLKLQCSVCKMRYILISARKAIQRVQQWSQFSGTCPDCTRQSTRERSYSRETSYQTLIKTTKVPEIIEVIDF